MSWRKSSELKAVPFMSLDLTPGCGNLLGESYWEMTSPWLGGSSMLNTGPAPLSAEDVYSLSQILQAAPPRKYYLSRTACLGILRRSQERGKELPHQLKAALMVQAGVARCDVEQDMGIHAYHINQRNEGIDLGGISGALMRTQNMQMQTFVTQQMTGSSTNQQGEEKDIHEAVSVLSASPGIKKQREIPPPPGVAHMDNSGERTPGEYLFTAGFCAGAAPSAGSIGYREECSPTLRAAESGTNMVPSVLCLNDQGGSAMDCSEDITGTLRAQEHGHQPILFENHGIDSRYTGPHSISPTLSARAGTGGNNLPLALQTQKPAYDPTQDSECAAVSRQKADIFKEHDAASLDRHHYQNAVGALTSSDRKGPNSQYVRQDKLIVDGPLLIRRLTPLECERLQGFPDYWTDIHGASDSSRYKALGNSVAIPCVEYIMKGIMMAAALH